MRSMNATKVANEQLAGFCNNLPLILDESFANLDSNRLYQVMKFLRACGRQSLLFSCQTREKENME